MQPAQADFQSGFTKIPIQPTVEVVCLPVSVRRFPRHPLPFYFVMFVQFLRVTGCSNKP